MDNLCIKNPFNGPIFYFEQTTSTMDEARKNLIPGAIFFADHQTQGRGRFPDRKWLDHKGQNLLFTLILDKKFAHNLPISIIVALSLVDVLDMLGIKAYIKWPNDILVDNKKISGILVESIADFFLLGVGVNINLDTIEITDKPVISLKQILGHSTDRVQFLEDFLEKLFLRLAHPQHWNKDVNMKLWRKNEEVTFSLSAQNQQKISGKIIGIASDGAIMLMGEAGSQKLYAGESEF